MADPKIKIKRSAVEGKIPTPDQVPLGEIALNTYDGKLFASQNVGIGTTVFVVNPWSVGTGTNTYNTYFTDGSVGIGTNNPTSKLSVVGDGNFTGVVTATSFSGDGSLLTGIIASGSGVVIQNQGSTVGTATTINFSTNLTASFSGGVATVTATGGGGGGGSSITRTTTRFVATEGQTSFSVTYTVGNIDVFLNGAKLDSTEYTATNGTTVVLTEGASVDDVLEFVTFSVGGGGVSFNELDAALFS